MLESSLLLPIIFGGTLAGMVHTTKAATRLASTASTAGIANVGISIAEDVTVVVATLLSLFAPIVMVVVVEVFAIIFLAVVPPALPRAGPRPAEIEGEEQSQRSSLTLNHGLGKRA